MPVSLGRDTSSAALSLIHVLYRASVGAAEWREFAAEFSRAVSGAEVILAIREPEALTGWELHGAGVADLSTDVAERLHDVLGVATGRIDDYTGGFASLGDAFPRRMLEAEPFFREWMQPRGFAPIWPLCHEVRVDGSVRARVLLQPRVRAGFDAAAACALGNALVPHLARAFAIQREIGAHHRKRRAFEEVLDRLPAGVLWIDASRRVIQANMGAHRMLALDDGLSLRDGRLCAHDPAEQQALDAEIDAAIDAVSRGAFDHVGRAAVSSRSGRRPFFFGLRALLPAVPGSPVHDAVAVVFLANPDAVSAASVQALEAVYGLTAAEAAIVQRLVEGATLDEIARERGVKVETARSQLKQVFGKTRTSRQAELIRLVLTGVSPLSQSIQSRDRHP